MTKHLFLLIIFSTILSSPSYAGSQTKPETHSEITVVTSKTLDKRRTGLRIYKPGKCYKGYTLFTESLLKKSSSLLGNFIYLIDMKGEIANQWIPEITPSPFFARLKQDGHLCFINAEALVELDAQSNIVWHYPGYIDHAFQILENGNFLIERNEYRDKNGIPCGGSIVEIIDPDKKTLWRWAGREHLDELKRITGHEIPKKGDWDNNNTCSLLKDNVSGRIDRRFCKGNIMFSYNAHSEIGIIDYPSGEIVWAWGAGTLQDQHTPSMLGNGNILIFDNGVDRGWSRIIEVNPLTEKIVWEYRAEPRESFYSHIWSNVSQLPNGNMLICEATSNRIFEITPEGEVVWDFISPFGKTKGTHGIYRAYRYSPEYVKPLFDKIEKNRSLKNENKD